MPTLTELWLPILLSGVFVFIASSVLHMLVPLHKGDFRKLPQEDSVLKAIRDAGVTPDDYMFPYCTSMKDACSPEYLERCKQGPVGYVTFLPNGPMNMGRALLQWFVLTLVVSLFVAYVASIALPSGASYRLVFRVTGTIAVLAYSISNVTNSIWKGVRWSTTAKFVFDGVIYGLVTAGTFGWLWPDASS